MKTLSLFLAAILCSCSEEPKTKTAVIREKDADELEMERQNRAYAAYKLKQAMEAPDVVASDKEERAKLILTDIAAREKSRKESSEAYFKEIEEEKRDDKLERDAERRHREVLDALQRR